MQGPLIIVDNEWEDFPFLVQGAEDLPVHVEELHAYTFYGVEGRCVAEVRPSGNRPGFWQRLFRTTHQSYSIKLSAPEPHDIAELKQKLAAYIEADDDCLTQYHEAAVLQFLLKDCCTFAEVLAMGCITGMFHPSGSNPTLPELCEDDMPDSDADELSVITGTDYHGALTIENIRKMSGLIVFETMDDCFQC